MTVHKHVTKRDAGVVGEARKATENELGESHFISQKLSHIKRRY